MNRLAPTLRSLRRLFALCRTIVESYFDLVGRYFVLRRQLSSGERAAWLHYWSSRLLGRWEIQHMFSGAFPGSGVVVSNHLSYLDVLLFSAARPCVFVSKSDVRRWPVLGSLAQAAGTLFVDRRCVEDTLRVNREIQKRLYEGVVVVLFPEGTSSDGSSVLPFRSSLFESAAELGANITAACVSYTLKDGSVAEDICYWGDMTFAPHLVKLLSKEGISGAIQIGPPFKAPGDRKYAAKSAHEAVLGIWSETR